ncbi:MAG TPA: sigma-70 family RNA polymerase sigma factor [Pirellulales bacterium]|nr:sigma-70 family RNA polymerase sigma factor [Pirellulales bacterium]
MPVGEPFAHIGRDTSGSTASSLIRLLRGESPAAWTRFAAIYTPLVYRWVRQAGVSTDDAADVVQDVFQGVARQIAQFRHEKPGDTFRGWLHAITRHKVCDHFRRRRDQIDPVGGTDMQARLAAVAAEVGDSSHELCHADDRALVVRNTVEQIRGEFQPTTWTAFWRLAIEGHPAAEIGRDLGLTAKAVRQAKYRVLKRLRDELSSLE